METKTIDIEPKWSNMAEYFCPESPKKIQAILNGYQGFRDIIKRKDSEFAKAVLRAFSNAGFNITDMEGK